MSVTNTDIRLIRWCKDASSVGCVYVSDAKDSKTRKVAHRWECSTQSAVDLIRLIYPYLMLKREQADVALAFQGLIMPRNACLRGGVPHWNKEERLHLVGKIRELNHRGRKTA